MSTAIVRRALLTAAALAGIVLAVCIVLAAEDDSAAYSRRGVSEMKTIDEDARFGAASPQGSSEQPATVNAENAPSDGGALPRAVPELPFGMEGSWRFAGYERSDDVEHWNFEADDDVEECARCILAGLETAHAELISSSYLDMGGHAWGCVGALPDGAGAAVVTVFMPTDGPTKVRVARYAAEGGAFYALP